MQRISDYFLYGQSQFCKMFLIKKIIFVKNIYTGKIEKLIDDLFFKAHCWPHVTIIEVTRQGIELTLRLTFQSDKISKWLNFGEWNTHCWKVSIKKSVSTFYYFIILFIIWYLATSCLFQVWWLKNCCSAFFLSFVKISSYARLSL